MSIGGIIALIWPFVWHYGLGVAALAVAAAVGLLTSFRREAAFAAAIIAAGLVGYTMGISNGKAYVQSRWDAAEQAMRRAGAKARGDAEALIPPVAAPDPPLPVLHPGDRRMCLDAYDRDCR